jgi:hypothetical protein
MQEQLPSCYWTVIIVEDIVVVVRAEVVGLAPLHDLASCSRRWNVHPGTVLQVSISLPCPYSYTKHVLPLLERRRMRQLLDVYIVWPMYRATSPRLESLVTGQDLPPRGQDEIDYFDALAFDSRETHPICHQHFSHVHSAGCRYASSEHLLPREMFTGSAARLVQSQLVLSPRCQPYGGRTESSLKYVAHNEARELVFEDGKCLF